MMKDHPTVAGVKGPGVASRKLVHLIYISWRPIDLCFGMVGFPRRLASFFI